MSTLTININEKLKAKAQKKSKKDGLNLTALIAQLLKMYVKEDCELCLEIERKGLRLKPEIEESIREADEEFANGTAKLYDNVDEMMEDIFNEPDESENSNDLPGATHPKV